ncbi:MAG TPA: hypothetical protein VFP61_12335 [Acidimicrobiales bacterium]|nr:hypothetical protein [Acidimicrobiales bacterium]
MPDPLTVSAPDGGATRFVVGAGAPGLPPGAAARAAASLGPALLAATLAVAAQLLGLHGTDQAMQVFMVGQVRAHGLSVLDTAWYGGVYPMAYSAAFPLIGALLGVGGAAVAAGTGAAWAFDRLVTAHFGRRPLGSWYFAASTLVQVGIGELPFLCGEAFGLLAVLALVHRRRPAAVALGVVAALCSPLAAAFLAMVCLAWWAHQLPRATTVGETAGGAGAARARARRLLALAAAGLTRRPGALALAAASMGVVGVLALAFPGTGPFPFTWTELVVVELLCAAVLSPLVATTSAVRLAVAVYGVASLVSFLVPNPLGGNAGRLASAVGVPLLACFVSARTPVRPRAATRWRSYGAVVLVPFAVWQWAPSLSAVRPAHDAPSSTAAFFAPLLHHLAATPPAASRVEVVPLADHWEAAYVGASRLSLARGWERQIDTARNPVFYTPGALTGDSYRSWLLANGVSWVAMPRVPLAQVDYAGVQERALLTGGAVPGLTRVWQSSGWVLWRVDRSPGLVSGPASLRSLEGNTVVLEARRPGQVVVRLRASRYWSLQPAAAGCVGATADGWTALQVTRPGRITLHPAVGPARGPSCPAPPIGG